jgi:hypothetical protein
MAESCPASHEIDVVRQLIDAVRAGQAQDPIALAEAQERGFGVLMSLEAQLQHAQRGSGGSTQVPVVAPSAGAELQELKNALAELADAITELRELACPAGSPSRVGYGFVLPGRSAARARRGTQA